MRQGAVKWYLQSFSTSPEQKWDSACKPHPANSASQDFHWQSAGFQVDTHEMLTESSERKRERRGPRANTTDGKDSVGPKENKTLPSKGTCVKDLNKYEKGKGGWVAGSHQGWKITSLCCLSAACQDHRLLNTSRLIQVCGPPSIGAGEGCSLDMAYKKSLIIHTSWRICVINVSSNQIYVSVALPVIVSV